MRIKLKELLGHKDIISTLDSKIVKLEQTLGLYDYSKINKD